MSRKPPYARMRQLKRGARRLTPTAAPVAPIVEEPVNVEEAMLKATSEPEIKVIVGVIEATVTPGPDKKFGTEDDAVVLTSARKYPEVVELVPDPEPEVPEPVKVIKPEPKEKKPPSYNKKMAKDELLAIAKKHGVKVKGSKGAIVKALDAHFHTN